MSPSDVCRYGWVGPENHLMTTLTSCGLSLVTVNEPIIHADTSSVDGIMISSDLPHLTVIKSFRYLRLEHPQLARILISFTDNVNPITKIINAQTGIDAIIVPTMAVDKIRATLGLAKQKARDRFHQVEKLDRFWKECLINRSDVLREYLHKHSAAAETINQSIQAQMQSALSNRPDLLQLMHWQRAGFEQEYIKFIQGDRSSSNDTLSRPVEPHPILNIFHPDRDIWTVSLAQLDNKDKTDEDQLESV
jgi:hypothetical protein